MENQGLSFTTGEVPQTRREQFKSAISHLVEPYTIRRGDTLDAIARANDLPGYTDLLAINRLIDPEASTKYEPKGKRAQVIIREGDSILVPKKGMKSQLDAEIQAVRQYAKTVELNRAIASGTINLLRHDIEGKIFDRSPSTISSERFLSGFIREQERSMDPKLPPIIDERNRGDVACIHMLRRLDYLRVNNRDRSSKERAYVLKPNIDAWEVQVELEKIGYARKFDGLARATDPKLAQQAGIPVSAEKRSEYDKLVLELGEHLDKNGVPGSYMSTSYRFSRYRSAGSREHPNTHQMMYLGNAKMEFPAYEFPYVKNGKVIKHTDDLGLLRQKATELESSIPRTKSEITRSAESLAQAIHPQNTLHLQRSNHLLEGILDRTVSHLSGKNRDDLRLSLAQNFATRDVTKIAEGFARVFRRPVEAYQNDAKYVAALQKQKDGVEQGLKTIRDALEAQKGGNPKPIPTENLEVIQAKSSSIKEALNQYNTLTTTLEQTVKEVETVRKSVENYAKDQESVKFEFNRRLVRLQDGHSEIKASFDVTRTGLLQALDVSRNPELATSLGNFQNRVKRIFGPSAERILTALDSSDTGTIERLVTSEADRTYLQNLFRSHKRAVEGIERIRAQLQDADTPGSPINLASMSRILDGNTMIREAVMLHNPNILELHRSQIAIDASQEKLRQKNTISAVDFFANFVAARSDTLFSLSPEGRNAIMDGIRRYPKLIRMSINGVVVDFEAEMKKPEKARVKVSPQDRVSISGPMMLDGFHRLQADGTKNGKMDSRTRFYSEALVSGLMFPTELHEPTESSVYGRKNIDGVASRLAIKGMYSLNPKEELGKVLIARIEKEFEREEFAKLEAEFPNRISDPSQSSEYLKKRQILLNRFYARQIQALQLAGYLENEDRINPLATNANRPIPYFDTSSANFSSIYAEYIRERKEASKKRFEQYAEDSNFISFKVFPGDTYRAIFERISDRVSLVAQSQPKYTELANIKGFDTAMDRAFLRACFQEFFEKFGWEYAKAYGLDRRKMSQQDQIETFMTGRIKTGSQFILTLDDILRIFKEVQQSFAFRDIKVKPLDDEVIRMVAGTERAQGFMKAILVRESYIPEGSIGARRFVKEFYGGAKSQTDFQIRFLRTSLSAWKSGKETEWPKTSDYLRAFDLLETDRFKHLRAGLSPQVHALVDRDISTIRSIRPLLEDSQKRLLTDNEIQKISEGLLPMLRMDDGSGSNVVGKIIGATLLERRLDILSTKLEGVLQKTGSNIEAILARPEGRAKFNETILLTNNLGEKDVFLFGITENYMLRILNVLSTIEGNGKIYTSREISENKKLGMIPTGQKELGTQVFVEHMRHLASSITKRSQLPYQVARVSEGNTSPLLPQADGVGIDSHHAQVRNIILNTANKIQQAAATGKRGLALDADISKVIYSFFEDPKLKFHLDAIRADSSLSPETRTILGDDILPRAEERVGFLWSYNDRRKEDAEPGKRNNIFEFTGRAIRKVASL